MPNHNIRIWHQSFTVLANLPAYVDTLRNHMGKVVRKGTEIVMHGMHPATYTTEYPGTDISYCYLHQLHANQFVANGLAAQQQGYDVFAICTLPDPALREVRSLLDIPVVAYGETAMHVASLLGGRFGIILFIEELIPLLEENALRYGLSAKLAGVRHAGFYFRDLLPAFQDHSAAASIVERFQESARKLVAQGAEALIPGEAVLCVLLASHGVREVDGAPVVDAVATIVKMAEMMADLHRIGAVGFNRSNYFSRKPQTERVMEAMSFYGLDKLIPQK